MVERLKIAIDKALSQREGARPVAASQPPLSPHLPSTPLLDRLPTLPLDEAALRANRIVAGSRDEPASMSFDVLRTRVLRACAERGWRRIAITSPTKGCGKSVISANFALSVARLTEARPLLFDADLRSPTIARLLGLREPRDIGALLAGAVAFEEHLVRLGPNLIVAANTRPIPHSAELIQNQVSADTLNRLYAELRPSAVIFDLAPILVSDDVLGFLPQVDAVILVVAAGLTRPREVAECERLLGDTPFLGVVLNKDEVDAQEAYRGVYASA